MTTDIQHNLGNRPARRGASTVRRRASWLLVGLLAVLPLQSIFHQPVGWAPWAAVFALAVFAAVRPVDAVFLLAALIPLSEMIFVLIRANSGRLRLAEAMVLACIAGWSLRRVAHAQPLRVSDSLRWTAIPLIAAALASALISGAVMATEDPTVVGTGLLPAFIVRNYLVDLTPVSAALLLAEGLVLLLIVADTCAADDRRRDLLLRMLVVGAAAAALMNLLRVVEVTLRQGGTWSAFLTYLATLRVNVHYADLNAAGSFFAMMVFLALGLAGRLRVLAVAGAVLIAIAVWISGSRAAMAAVFVTAALAGLIALRGGGFRRRASTIAALVVVAATAFVVWTWYPTRTNTAAASWSLSTRIELSQAALAMAAAHPIFGVGVGGFYILSNEYVGETLTILRKERENAHNYFLQVLAELGVPGLVLFLSVVLLPLRAAVRDPVHFRRSWGLIAGLCAYLVTCLGGHPLLVPAAAYPFWIALGAAASIGWTPTKSARLRVVGIAVVAVFVVSLPFRTVAAVRRANVENTTIGLSPLWQWTPDGSRFRWAGTRATFFVPSSARAMRIPLHHGSIGSDELEVRIFIDGREADRMRLPPRDEWRTVRLVFGRDVKAPFSRIDLETRAPGEAGSVEVQPTNAGGVLMVGRPVIEE